MKVLLVVAGVLCLALLAAAETCGWGSCPGVGRCCYGDTEVYKCAPFDNAVCCPGGDYSCPPGKSCVKVLWFYICVNAMAVSSDGSFDFQKGLSEALMNTKKSYF
ncbi:uncharacterized protein [Parasteatoda tepidariorum]|uniref:uncharacterized protein isoform X1 n=1 Tax=Parasteatoda tepidariorum TaxID=114398 RepID=UPI00077F9508|nr:uncharacterized protein LOC107453860 isoform X1 [Parasteatoda tepidariorum]